ncbi:hypothetical protein MMC09_002790 [Bachmanniomyces sp. S44760]|nr:hypothetical protein [Bachmanniomyces sp. S44760]
MGLFKSLKGDLPDKVGVSGSSIPPAHTVAGASNNTADEVYEPPAGPPPSWRNHSQEYEPPAGPPPSWKQETEEYDPPPGPPPSQRSAAAPAAPYHDWTSIPDTALLPPPPSLGNDASPSSNANTSDAERAHVWCEKHPLLKPRQPTNAQIVSARNGDSKLVTPQGYKGRLAMQSKGRWRGSTRAGSTDSCLQTEQPLYFSTIDSPMFTEQKKTIYYEVRILSLGPTRGEDAPSLALGYCAAPYPTWRMPGWERGSLAIHSDDGRRYVNDTYGGKDFTEPIRTGEIVGIGLSFSVPESPPEYGASPEVGSSLTGEVFFTRNGKVDGGWNLREELDADDEFGVLGVDGQFDLYGAVGIFGEVEFEICFDKHDWRWQPA